MEKEMRIEWRVFILTLSLCVISTQLFSAESLTFEQRVKAQEAIERVYYNHRIWPADNPDPKPSFETVVNDISIDVKVKDFQNKSYLLEKVWQKHVDNTMLQAEIDRIVKKSKDRTLLKELFDALDNNPTLIAECLARPILTDRLVRSLYANDSRFHSKIREEAKIAASELRIHGFLSGNSYRKEIVRYVDENRTGIDENEVDGEIVVRLLKTDFAKLIENSKSRGSVFMEESADALILNKPVSVNQDSVSVERYIFEKQPFDEWLNEESKAIGAHVPSAIYSNYKIPEVGPEPEYVCTDGWLNTSLDDIPDPRYGHTAVWTGTEMIVWGGGSNSGGRYNPVTDSWTPTSRQLGVPAPRSLHTAVWTGDRMIIWGGWDGTTAFKTGAQYNPSSDTWSSISYNSPCPSARKNHTAVWSGTEMIIWAGVNGSDTLLNDGARYNPTTNTWTTLSTIAPCPDAREYATAVFINGEMIVWGGDGTGDVPLNTGGRYSPATDTWTATSTTGDCPAARRFHTAIEGGSGTMLVWGGEGSLGSILNTGAKYVPTTDTWTAITTTGCPAARRYHSAVWTGELMIIWGGEDGTSSMQTGGKYDPALDSWTTTATGGYCPTARYQHTAIWTGTEMVVWGGYWPTNTGGKYDPDLDTWTATNIGTSIPAARQGHTAVWTGSEMIVWGGWDGISYLNTGGGCYYYPATDTWIWNATGTGTNVPAGRQNHTAVWTGTEMIIWGGWDGTSCLNTGGAYNPTTVTWADTNIGSNIPAGRRNHTAVWTGTYMVIWGGHSGSQYLSSGGRYNPVGTPNRWATMAAYTARQDHTAVWTGTYMLVWGGFNGTDVLNTGGAYNPVGNTWTAMSSTNAPSARRYHSAVWAPEINSMIVWGGENAYPTGTGCIYNATTKIWSATSTSGCPTERKQHSAVWTGQEMIIWGGRDPYGYALDNGARLDVCSGTWKEISEEPSDPPPSRYLHTAVWTGTKMIVWGGAGALCSGGIYEPPPQIVGPCESCGSDPVTLTAGNYSSYKWYKDGITIAGATTQTYSATETGDYKVRVTLPDSTVCDGAVHHVEFWDCPVPVIDGDSEGCINPGVVLTTGDYVFYQWIRDGVDITGATAKTYTATIADDYTVRVTDLHGCVGTSEVFSVPNNHPTPTITQTPTPQGCPTLLSTELYASYQWKLNNAIIIGATSREYTAEANGSYKVTVVNDKGCTGTSDASVVSNYPEPAITGDSTGCVGSVTTLSTGAYATYQWYRAGTFIDGATSQTYDAVQSGSYTVAVTDSLGCSGVSDPKTVTFYEPPTPTVTGPASGTGCSSAILSTTTAYSHYQWMLGENDISGATARDYTATATGNYKVRVTDSRGCIATSDVFPVTIFDLPQPLISGGTPANCGITLSTGSYVSYQWFKGTTQISGATASSYTATETGYYKVLVQDSNGCSAQSPTGYWVNLDPPDPGIYKAQDSYCYANDTVRAYEKSGTTLYFGGDFTSVTTNTGSGIIIDPTSGKPDAAWPKVDGIVYAIEPDGTGGYYLGGNFTKVGGYSRTNIVHLKADKSVDQDFAPLVDNAIRTILVGNAKIYIGGDFHTVNTQTRNHIAVFDSTNGQLTTWDPNMNNIVYALALSGSTLYAGGSFTTVAGVTAYNRLVAIDTGTGDVISTFNPSISNGIVYALALSEAGTTLYAGGTFTTVGGATYNRLAAFDAGTGSVISTFIPNIGAGTVYVLALSDSTLYAGGTFTLVNGSTTRNRLAALNTSTGTTTDFNPNMNNAVYALALSGSTLYAGGLFTTVNGGGTGNTRNRLAALNTSTGIRTDFDPNMNDTVWNLDLSNPARLVAGGEFSTTTITRNYLASLDMTTGEVTDWNPNMGSTVYTLALSGTTLYAGGAFTTVGGATYNRLAAFDTGTGSVISTFNPNISSTSAKVYALALSGTTLYAGGYFTQVNGSTTRNRLAALDASTGTATTFNPNMGNTVYALALSDDKSTLYAGGQFITVGGISYNRLAAWNITTGNILTDFTSDISNGIVYALALSETETTLYAGGTFYTVGGVTYNRLAAFDTGTGDVISTFNPNMNNLVYSLTLSGSTLYAGGAFTTVNGGGTGNTRNRLAALDASTGTATSWDPNANNIVYVMLPIGSEMHIGGDFTTLEGGSNTLHQRLAAIPADLPATQCARALLLHTEMFDSYQWLKDGNELSGENSQAYEASEPGDYTVKVSDSNGCEATTDAITVSFTVLEPQISGGSSNTCPATSVDLSTTTFSSYQWYLDDVSISGATNQTYTASTLGTHDYTVVVTDANGCSAESPAHAVTISTCGGLMPPPEIAAGTEYPADAQSWIADQTSQVQSWPSTETATGYRLYRGFQSDLPNLLTSEMDFCTRCDGVDLSFDCTGDDASLVNGRCYYYLVTAYNKDGEGPAGFASAGQKQIDTTGICQ